MTQHIPQLRPAARPEPSMPAACQSGGCGGMGDAPRLPPLPDFGEVRVNGVEIAPEAIAQEIQHHPADDPAKAWAGAARALALRELLLQEARRLGVEAAPEIDEAGRAETEEDAVIAALLDRVLEPARPDEIECRRCYAAQRDRFRTPDLFEAAHILIEPEGDGEEAWRAAGIQARAIIHDVGDDARAFAAAARQLSCCPSAAQDGTLGQIRRGDLVPEIQSSLETLAEGATCRHPVRSRFGWHVLRLARRIEGQVLPFEAVHDKIADMLEARSWSVAATRYVAALAAENRVEGIRLEPVADPAAL